MNPNNDFLVIGDHVPIHGIGDSILLTGLARELNTLYPGKKIVVRTKGSRIAFENNPRIHSIEEGLLEKSIDDGGGHYLVRKCRHFGINLKDEDVRGELFLTDTEIAKAKQILEVLSPKKKTIIFCKGSTDKRRDAPASFWGPILQELKECYDIYQVDQHAEEDVPYARQELRDCAIRDAMALQYLSKRYLGTNTGFYHIAHCFGTNNFTFMHKQFAGGPEWTYPLENFIWNDEPLDSIRKRIRERWINV